MVCQQRIWRCNSPVNDYWFEKASAAYWADPTDGILIKVLPLGFNIAPIQGTGIVYGRTIRTPEPCRKA